jgi:anti-anti-sigma regulatory factor
LVSIVPRTIDVIRVRASMIHKKSAPARTGQDHSRAIIDLSDTCAIDTQVLRLILMLRKTLKGTIGDLVFVGLSTELTKIFRLNGMGFLLATEPYDASLKRTTHIPWPTSGH